MVLTTEIARDHREDGDNMRNGLPREKNLSHLCGRTRTRGDKNMATAMGPLTRTPCASLTATKLLHLSGGNSRTNKEKGGKPWHRRVALSVRWIIVTISDRARPRLVEVEAL